MSPTVRLLPCIGMYGSGERSFKRLVGSVGTANLAQEISQKLAYGGLRRTNSYRVFALRQKPGHETFRVFAADGKYLSEKSSQQNSTGFAWQYQQTQQPARKPSDRRERGRGGGWARWDSGRMAMAARRDGRAGGRNAVPCGGGVVAVRCRRFIASPNLRGGILAVAVRCGPSLDLGWNNCNRLGNRRREP